MFVFMIAPFIMTNPEKKIFANFKKQISTHQFFAMMSLLGSEFIFNKYSLTAIVISENISLGAHGVMVTIIGNGYDNQSSNF